MNAFKKRKQIGEHLRAIHEKQLDEAYQKGREEALKELKEIVRELPTYTGFDGRDFYQKDRIERAIRRARKEKVKP